LIHNKSLNEYFDLLEKPSTNNEELPTPSVASAASL